MSEAIHQDYADIHGSPGTQPRLTGLFRCLWPLALLLIASGYLLRAALPQPGMAPTTVGFFLLILAGLFAWFISRSQRRMQAYIKGALGEETTARHLALLPASFTVFHGLEAGPGAKGTDLDHVVIGPTGLFVVETKNWSGKITLEEGSILYNGHTPSRPPLEQVKRNASLLEKKLCEAMDATIEVRPILCFANGDLQPERIGSSGVEVCNTNSLHQVLNDRVHGRLSPLLLDQLRQQLQTIFNQQRS